MIPLKYNTASQEIPLGYFLDDTDGKTSETGLTIANTDIKLWKSGATTLANKNSGGATHISAGIYYAVLDATDTNTYGPMKIFVQVAGALPVILECLVMEANAYDANYAALGTGYMESSLVRWLGTAPLALSSQRVQTTVGAMGSGVLTATAIASDAITAAKIAADAIGASELAADAASEIATSVWAAVTRTLSANTNLNDPTAAAIADAVWDEAVSGHVAGGSFGEEVQSHALSTEVDAVPTAAENRTEMDASSTQLAAIVADTNELQTNQGNWITAVGFSTHSAADVTTDMDANSTQLAAIVADTNELQTDDVPTLVAALPTAVENRQEMDSNSTQLAAIVADTGELQTDWVDGGRLDLIVDATLADTGELQTNQGNWLTATGFSTHSAADVTADIDANSAQLTAILADTDELQTNQGNWLTATGFSTHSAADVTADIDANSTQLAAIVADTSELQIDDVPGLIAALNDPTAAAIADQVWEEAVVDHSGTAGSTAEALAGATAPTAATVADAVWEEAIADHSGTSGSMAEALNAAGSAGDPWVTALPGAYGAGSAGNILGNINDLSASDVAAELATYDAPTKAELDSGFSALNDPTAAAIADAVWDEAATGHTDAGKAGEQLWTDVDAILADTDELQTNQGSWLTATGFSTHSAADVRTEVDSNSTQLAAIVADTDELQTNQGSWLTATGFSTHSAADVWAAVTRTLTAGTKDSEIDSILADTDELQSDDVPGLIAALENLSSAGANAAVDAAFTTIMADSVPADGTIPTREQALYMINQFLLERSTAGTTVTVKKADGSTTLMTLTLNDGTTPTSITRAT